MTFSMAWTRRLSGLVAGFGVLTLTAALVSYAYLGTFSRFYADDYCMSGLVVQRGFWQAQIDQFTGWSNRYAGMLVLSLFDFLGTQAVRFWTGTTLLLWVLALAWTLAQINRTLRLGLSKVGLLLLSELIIFVSMLLSPQVYQSFFWRIGIITYTLPLVFLTLMVGMVIRFSSQTQTGEMPWAGMAALAALAFFAGGFSETYLILQTGINLLALAGAALFIRSSQKRTWLVLFGAGLIGCVASLIVVLLAPGNAARQAFMPAPPGLLSLVKMTLGHTFLFLYDTLDSRAFQLLLGFFIPLWLVYLAFSGKNLPRVRTSHLILAFFICSVVAAVLVAGVMLPAAYAQSSYPDGRVLVEAAFSMAAATVSAGALAGMVFAQAHQVSNDLPPAFLQVIVAGLVCVMLLYPLYDTQKNLRLAPEYRAGAEVWDRREARIYLARMEGEAEISEKATNPPGGLGDITPDAADWVNICAAWFYDVKSITAGK